MTLPIGLSKSPPRRTRLARIAALACAGILGGAAAAQAASVSAGLQGQFGPGARDVSLNGDTRFGVISDGNDGTLDVGDRLGGQFVVRNIGTLGSPALDLGGVDNPASDVNELTGVVELEVISKTGNANTGFTYELGAFTSNGSVVTQSGNADAIIALYEDSARNGVSAGLPIPDPTLTDGQLFGYLGLNAPGTRRFTVTTVADENGIHSDASSGGIVSQSRLVSTGDVSLNLIDQNGAALSDSTGEYTFGTNPLGTQFNGAFNFFGGQGTGADFTGDLALNANVNVQIVPLPTAALAAIPGLLMAGLVARRRRLA